jgi:hypothetical protein
MSEHQICNTNLIIRISAVISPKGASCFVGTCLITKLAYIRIQSTSSYRINAHNQLSMTIGRVGVADLRISLGAQSAMHRIVKKGA